MSSEPATPRAQPYYCPYCSEQDFVPFGEEAGRYLCNSCNRHFSVRFLGIGRPQVDGPAPGKETDS